VLAFIIRRLVGLVVVLAVTATLLFCLMKAAPGDPARMIAGQTADPRVLERVRAEWHLDEPVLKQYAWWMGELARLRLPRSYVQDRPVSQVLANKVVATAVLAVSAIGLAFVLGVVAGMIGAVRQGTLVDAGVLTLSLVWISTPVFWLGLMFILLFSSRLRWLPTSGYGDSNLYLPGLSSITDAGGAPLFQPLPELPHLVLPAVSLALLSTGYFARMMRSSLLEVIRQDYIRTAAAKGLTRVRLRLAGPRQGAAQRDQPARLPGRHGRRALDRDRLRDRQPARRRLLRLRRSPHPPRVRSAPPMSSSRRLAAALLLSLLAAAPAGAERWRKPPRVHQSDVVAPTAAPGQPLPGGELQGAVLSARDAVLPALVHVEPILEVFQRGRKAKAAMTGSGVVVDREGHVLTNFHVVENAKRVKCVLADQREVEASIVGTDPLTDIAVLRLELPPERLPQPARLGVSSTLTAGQFVVALGSPLGLARSLSLGVVSTPDRYFPEDALPGGGFTGAYNTWIQTDAAINPGNSGGPLVDLSGRVVGINARAIPIFGENIGFAIPMDVVREVLAQLKSTGRVERSWVGVRWQHLEGLAGYFGAEERGGVLVGGVVADAPAAVAGLEAGDVVVAWDGREVSARFEEELPAFRKLVADTPVGRRVAVRLLRAGEEREVAVRTAPRPEAESDELELPDWGLTARDLTPEIVRRRRLQGTEGALITGVRAAGPASVADLRAGDVIREVERRPVKDTAELLELYRELGGEGRDRLLLEVDRGATIRLTILEPERD
jgi:serine protease Do